MHTEPSIKLRVIIESPFNHKDPKKKEEYRRYLIAARRDTFLNHNEAYFASHALYTDETDDAIPEQRTLGIEAGLLWLEVADKSVVYIDYDLSSGMKHGIKKAVQLGKPVEFRSLYRVIPKEEQEQLLARALASHTTDKEGHII